MPKVATVSSRLTIQMRKYSAPLPLKPKTSSDGAANAAAGAAEEGADSSGSRMDCAPVSCSIMMRARP
jgi:hypothetical protein